MLSWRGFKLNWFKVRETVTKSVWIMNLSHSICKYLLLFLKFLRKLIASVGAALKFKNQYGQGLLGNKLYLLVKTINKYWFWLQIQGHFKWNQEMSWSYSWPSNVRWILCLSHSYVSISYGHISRFNKDLWEKVSYDTKNITRKVEENNVMMASCETLHLSPFCVQ